MGIEQGEFCLSYWSPLPWKEEKRLEMEEGSHTTLVWNQPWIQANHYHFRSAGAPRPWKDGEKAPLNLQRLIWCWGSTCSAERCIPLRVLQTETAKALNKIHPHATLWSSALWMWLACQTWFVQVFRVVYSCFLPSRVDIRSRVWAREGVCAVKKLNCKLSIGRN